VHPGDCPEPRPKFTVFSRIEMDEHTDTVSVVFTPEGVAFFHAWLQQKGLDPAISMS
jgi:hypothetical protein